MALEAMLQPHLLHELGHMQLGIRMSLCQA